MKKNILISILLMLNSVVNAQGLFMVGAGSTSSPSPSAAGPIITQGITNSGSFIQNNTSTFNGKLTITNGGADITGDVKITAGNLDVPDKLAFFGKNVGIGINAPPLAQDYRLHVDGGIVVFENCVDDLYTATGAGIRFVWARKGIRACLLYTSPSPRDKRQSRMPSSA